MARKFMQYIAEGITPDADPRTLAQFEVAAGDRVVLHSIEVDPLGSLGASPPLEFDLIKQTTDGTSDDDTAAIEKMDPVFSEAIGLKVRKNFSGAEPTSSGNPKYRFSIHQTGSRLWVPQNVYREIIMQGAERWGLRYVQSSYYDVSLTFHLEE